MQHNQREAQLVRFVIVIKTNLFVKFEDKNILRRTFQAPRDVFLPSSHCLSWPPPSVSSLPLA